MKPIIKTYKLIKKLLKQTGIQKYSFAKKTNLFITNCLKSRFAKVQGSRMILDKNDSLNLSLNGIYEPYETKLIKQNIRRGDVVLDIGANIGYYTLLFSKLVGPTGRVYAFEPEPENFKILKRNIELNNCNNVILINKAVLETGREVTIFTREDNRAGSSIYYRDDSDSHVSVESVSIDNYFKDYEGKIDFIKIDIEGAEGKAMEGMYNILQKNKEVRLFTEFFPLLLTKCRTSPEEYLDNLIRHNFKLCNINEETKELESISVGEFLERYTPGKENHTNIFGIKRREEEKYETK